MLSLPAVRPLVEIEWEDAKALDFGPWVEDQPYTYEPFIVRTVGYVLFQDDSGIVLTDSVAEGMTGGVHQIPKGMIRNIKYV